MMITDDTESVPAPGQIGRDDVGRIVAATWDPSGIGRAGSGRWLVAVDGSEGSLRAAAMAARLLAFEPHPQVDLVHVLPWLVKEAAEVEVARRTWEITAEARAVMDRGGAAWRLHARMGEPAERIVALARELGSLGIAVGSHGLTAAESILLGSAASEVVHLSEMPVLVVR